MGKSVKMSGKTCRKWANGLKIDDSENIWTPGVCLPPPRGNIHVYYSDIQRSSFLKLFGQSKPNCLANQSNQSQTLCGAFLGRVDEIVYEWSRSHDQDGRHGYK